VLANHVRRHTAPCRFLGFSPRVCADPSTRLLTTTAAPCCRDSPPWAVTATTQHETVGSSSVNHVHSHFKSYIHMSGAGWHHRSSHQYGLPHGNQSICAQPFSPSCSTKLVHGARPRRTSPVLWSTPLVHPAPSTLTDRQLCHRENKWTCSLLRQCCLWQCYLVLTHAWPSPLWLRVSSMA
jgi:hypothetical protein